MSSSLIAAVLDELHDHLPAPEAQPFQITHGYQRALAEALAAVPDPRCRRGVRHRSVRGGSKERRLEPQITIGLLTDAAGCPWP
jgi:hypothetical protein